MTDYIKIKTGLDVPINGSPETRMIRDVVSHSIEIKPTDFRNLVPKLLVREGDRVLAGTPVFADKMRPEIKFASPVSGTVSAIVRGDKRKLLAVRVDADGERQSKTVNVPKLNSLNREQIIELMLENGLWPFIQQRPYGIIANPADTPKGIFISGFNTNPLAADYDYSLKDDFDAIQTGVDVLYKLLPEGIHFSLNTANHASSPFHKLERVKFHVFDGPHPAGNVGVQIHHIAPVNKGEVVWCVELALVAVIGRFFTTGIYNASRIVAVGGPCAAQKGYIKCLPGMMMKDIADLAGSDGVKEHEGQEVRYISGSILTGTNVGAGGSLGIFDTQITLIAEGRYNELFGWAKPFRSKHSISRAYFSWLCPKKKYNMDTNLNGGPRAFVTTGEYRKVFPMDIYPVHLLKACLAGDIEKMEELGIYEVVEEDFALCEYVCPSKINIQTIIRDAIAMMLKEMC